MMRNIQLFNAVFQFSVWNDLMDLCDIAKMIHILFQKDAENLVSPLSPSLFRSQSSQFKADGRPPRALFCLRCLPVKGVVCLAAPHKVLSHGGKLGLCKIKIWFRPDLTGKSALR